MKKKMFVVLLSLLMVFSLIPLTNVNAATDAGTLQVSITADKTAVKKGDTVHYTVSIGKVEALGYIELYLDIPAGLTYVPKTEAALAEANSAAKDALKAMAMAEFMEKKLGFAASGCQYSSEESLKLFEFDCTVDEDVTGVLNVGLKNDASFAGYAASGVDHDYALNVTLPESLKAEVTVAADVKVEVANGQDAIEEAAANNEAVKTALKQLETLETLFEEVTNRKTDAEKPPVIIAAIELTLPEGETMPKGGMDITLQVPGVKKGDDFYYLLHLKTDGKWENISVKSGDGTLTGHFTSLSPVYVLKAENTKPASASTTVTPQPTGDADTGILFAVLFAGCAAAGCAFFAYRRKVRG